MARHRDALPEDLKELVALCRAGRLFAVEEWIKAGKRIHPGAGNYAITPFEAAVKSGFHSLIEVFLRAGIEQDDKDRALYGALDASRLDLMELLVAYGADLSVIDADSAISQRNPVILRWLIDRGLDMEDGWPIAMAFKYKHREFLGIYMSLRDTVPSARFQANMALRFHAGKGSLKWVSLLMWAGADPRVQVPSLDCEPPEEWMGSALEDAVVYSQGEIVKKIGIDPSRDDASALLAKCHIRSDIEIVRLLLDAGADPNWSNDGEGGMHALMRCFEWALDSTFGHLSPDSALACLELAAARGGRWAPVSDYARRTLRQSLAKISSYTAIGYLHRLMKAQVFTQDVLRDLLNTPRMRELLETPAPGAQQLREFTSLKPVAKRKAPRKRRSTA